jgi:hypothetical protein
MAPAPPTERRDFLPVPDPTALTTDALAREIGALRELLEAKINANTALHLLLERRADGVAVELERQFRHADELSKGRKEAMDRDIDAARSLIETIRVSVEEKFAAQTVLTKQAQDFSQRAIDAALASANKQIDMLTSRLTEASLGAREVAGSRAGSSQVIAYIVALAVALVGVGGGALIAFVHSSGN